MVRFGSFAIDTRTWTLTRDGAPLDLSPRLVEILAYLVERDGAVATKEELLDRFWPDVHVTENTLTRAIADIRKAVGDAADDPRVIQTMARRGYRYVGRPPAAEAGDDPFEQWVSGRLALESLDPRRLADARAAMEAAVAAMPDYAPAHAGVANACLVAFEATRPRNLPDASLIAAAAAAARRAVAIDPKLGEAWAVLGHAQVLGGLRAESQASLRRAVSLEPDNWRHHFRLALAGWGEERLREADRALALLPSCAAAHLLSAMVYVARGAWDRAEAAAMNGARLQDAQGDGTVLPVAGLHWMLGLVHSARGQLTDAAAALAMETEVSSSGLYGNEFRWLAHSSLGYLHLHEGHRALAASAFRVADAFNHGAARSAVGLHHSGVLDGSAASLAVDELARGGKDADAALMRAAMHSWEGETDVAIDLLTDLVARAAPGPAGWSLGADPMFLPLRMCSRWPTLLATVAARAA
jgi:DNA-binding winged helix-turn-helix (wHTH) protein